MIVGTQRVYVGGYDVSGYITGLNIDVSVDALDATVLGDTTAVRAPGLVTPSISLDGLWDAPYDALAWIAAADHIPVTVAMQDGLDGDIAYFGQMQLADRSQSFDVGSLLTLELASTGAGSPLVRGRIGAPLAPRTDTGAGTPYELGAVPADSRIWCVSHVASVAGTSPSLSVSVESDDSSGMASPITQITLPAQNDVGVVIGYADGAINDTWWRIRWEITGTTPQFEFVAAFGISAK